MRELLVWWNRVSLRTKVTGATVLILATGLIVVGLGTTAVLRGYLLDEIDSRIQDSAVELLDRGTNIAALTEIASQADPLSRHPCLDSDVPNELYLALIASDGRTICSNRAPGDPQPSTELLNPDLIENSGMVTLRSTAPSGQWRVIVRPIVNSDIMFITGIDLEETKSVVSRYATTFLFFGFIVVIVGGALTRLLVTSTFAPLRKVEATAARFADGDFSQRLSGAIPNTEVGRLNRSLNSMLARIDRAFADRARTIEQMRRFVGDASHELRTPLVSLRGYAELYRMGAITSDRDIAQAMGRIEKEAIRMGELVEDLLELARLDEAKPLQLTEINLVLLAHDAALDAMASAPGRVITIIGIHPAVAVDSNEPATLEPQPRQALGTSWPESALDSLQPGSASHTSGRMLSTGPIVFANALRRLARRPRTSPEAEPVEPRHPEATTRAIIRAEENKIRQVLANLMGNAVRFTPDGSPIEIAVGVDSAKASAILSVIDHGPGVPPEIRTKIFQRFWRADASRTRETGGSGLGLAIVSAIISAHKGQVEVVETAGGGATFRVLLPLSSPQPAPFPFSGTPE